VIWERRSVQALFPREPAAGLRFRASEFPVYSLGAGFERSAASSNCGNRNARNRASAELNRMMSSCAAAKDPWNHRWGSATSWDHRESLPKAVRLVMILLATGFVTNWSLARSAFRASPVGFVHSVFSIADNLAQTGYFIRSYVANVTLEVLPSASMRMYITAMVSPSGERTFVSTCEILPFFL
jgi:hypothetical protein